METISHNHAQREAIMYNYTAHPQYRGLLLIGTAEKAAVIQKRCYVESPVLGGMAVFEVGG